MTTVLVIEDEQPILENVLEMLELEGHEVIAAENGAVGVQMAQQHSPDIIICDITMPEMDGYQVLPMRLSELLMAAINLARRFAYRHPDVTIRLDERDREAVVICNMHALKHALAELITNALSFSPAGGEVLVSQWRAENPFGG